MEVIPPPYETVPEGFIKVPGMTINGTETWNPESNVFVSGRKITIRKLLVSDHEVTQGEYETYCKYGENAPSEEKGKGANYPAYGVNWYDAIVYCNLRSIKEGLTPVYKLGEEIDPKNWPGIVSDGGKYCGILYSGNEQWKTITMDIEANGYRLPTEAEWEYLARGGKTDSYEYSGSDGNTEDSANKVSWSASNSSNKVHEVKQLAPNVFGLYDMSGNVQEWCWDWYDDDNKEITSETPETGVKNPSNAVYRVLRGGSYKNNYLECSVDRRNSNNLTNRFDELGFRVVHTTK